MFYEKLAERENKSGWMESGENIMMIPDSMGKLRKLINEYGRLVVENIEENTQKCIRQQTRQSHNSVQLFRCLTNSTEEATHLKIVEE